MPVDLDLLPKLISPSEEKKLKVFANYIFFDVFSEKVSYPIFKDRVSVINQQKKFDLFKMFKEICGPNKKYINLPRLTAAFMGYQMNSKEYSTELKNFMSFITNELIGDYNDKYLGLVTKNMKEYSTKNMANRKAVSCIQVFCTPKNEIVGLQIEYDDKYKNLFIAPGSKNTKYDLKININLKKNKDFLDDDEEDDEENDYARDYITHIFGTYSNVIDSIGFKTAFGKHYYTGKPQKGKQFLFGTTKSRFHIMKFGMETQLNCVNFKFKPALENPNLAPKFKDFVEEDYERKYKDEETI